MPRLSIEIDAKNHIERMWYDKELSGVPLQISRTWTIHHQGQDVVVVARLCNWLGDCKYETIWLVWQELQGTVLASKPLSNPVDTEIRDRHMLRLQEVTYGRKRGVITLHFRHIEGKPLTGRNAQPLQHELSRLMNPSPFVGPGSFENKPHTSMRKSTT